MKYSAKYFKDNMPEWKRKKDPILVRFFYRPLSFYVAAFAANNRISANSVSYFSGALGVVAALLFLLNNHAAQIAGAILINVWLLLDCVDGNLARSVRKQPFGEFADGISSYILVGLMCTCMAVSVYFDGGLFIPSGCIWIVLLGAFASEADTLMRLIYQKYTNTAKSLQDAGVIPVEVDKHTDHSQVSSFRVRVELELGLAGILPPAILIATIFRALDLIVIYCFVYYVSSCIASSLLHIKKTFRYKDISMDKR